eukprot:1420618-Rhodomonas_salina.2
MGLRCPRVAAFYTPGMYTLILTDKPVQISPVENECITLRYLTHPLAVCAQRRGVRAGVMAGHELNDESFEESEEGVGALLPVVCTGVGIPTRECGSECRMV